MAKKTSLIKIPKKKIKKNQIEFKIILDINKTKVKSPKFWLNKIKRTCFGRKNLFLFRIFLDL